MNEQTKRNLLRSFLENYRGCCRDKYELSVAQGMLDDFDNFYEYLTVDDEEDHSLDALCEHAATMIYDMGKCKREDGDDDF